MGNSC